MRRPPLALTRHALAAPLALMYPDRDARMRRHAARPPPQGTSLARPGAPDRAGRPGLRRSPARRRAGRLGAAPRARPGRADPDRLGQRAPARALPPAVRAARALPDRRARPRVLARSAAVVRVLGPRGVADPRRAAAASALAHG